MNVMIQLLHKYRVFWSSVVQLCSQTLCSAAPTSEQDCHQETEQNQLHSKYNKMKMVRTKAISHNVYRNTFFFADFTLNFF